MRNLDEFGVFTAEVTVNGVKVTHCTVRVFYYEA